MPSLHMFINKIVETFVSKQIKIILCKKEKNTQKSKPKKAPLWAESCLLLPLDYALWYTVS